mmetsp:Transcript_48652/g.80697  ORF Transcript_48652/g.80697 Transcript_48652/m.80697 type:complete len:83 (+) Transcript_48652:1307-1555(+)
MHHKKYRSMMQYRPSRTKTCGFQPKMDTHRMSSVRHSRCADQHGLVDEECVLRARLQSTQNEYKLRRTAKKTRSYFASSLTS